MKLLHTADWHLGKRLEQFSRLEEQRLVMNEICEIAEREDPDAVLIAGDLYDQINPSVEATELLYQTLHRLAGGGRRAVIGIAGNHDSPDRIEAPDPLARACGIVLLGYPNSELSPFEVKNGLQVVRSAPGFLELKLPRQEQPLRLLLTPYANEVRLRRFLGEKDPEATLREILSKHWKELVDEYCDDQGVNVLMTHLFVTPANRADELAELEDEEEKSLASLGGAQQVFTSDLPTGIQYAALGHIHSYLPIQQEPYPVVYSSSPLVYSLGDKQSQKQVVLVELEAGKPAVIQRIPLKQGKSVCRMRFDSVATALSWLHENPTCLVELIIQVDEHLNAADRKRLFDAHVGILKIIPEFNNPDQLRFTSGKQVDLDQNIHSLFEEYFQHRKGTPMNEELRGLFQEILNED